MILDIYIDESSQTKARYLLLGCIVVPSAKATLLVDSILSARLPLLPHGEMKWGKVSSSKLPAYESVVNCFFDDPLFSDVHFHSLFVDTAKLDHKRFNAGSAEVGFNKEIYQLASKCARLYNRELFHVYPDYRDTKSSPEELRTILNFGRKKLGDCRDWPFRRCHFRDSRTTPILWLTDLLMGAVGYHINGHRNAPGASTARSALSDHILWKARVNNPLLGTAMKGKFTIWPRQLN